MNFDHHLIDRDPFRESVIRMLEEAIIKLELKPGDRLVETKISETFGVSRGPVREAILDLEARGLVERTPFKGAVVSTLTQNDIDELKSCRMDVETLAIKIIFASNKDINGVVEKLQSMMQEMVNAAHQNNLPEFLALDYQFHDELIHQAANSLLEEMWKPVSVRLRRYFFLNSRHGYIPLEEAVKQHQAIIDAITAGDANKTSELLRAHHCWS
jgi:DNA-binding GntR family transcriptional regulator